MQANKCGEAIERCINYALFPFDTQASAVNTQALAAVEKA